MTKSIANAQGNPGWLFGTHFQHAVVRNKQIPWTPWGMFGTQFKLLHCNDASGLLVVFLKVEPGTIAGVHKPFGAAHACVVEAGFGHEHGEVF